MGGVGAPPQRILIFKPCCIGDVLMATPLAVAIRARWPEARVDWAVGAHSRGLLVDQPHVDRLLDAAGCMREDLRPTRIIALARAVRRGEYDVALIPDRSPIGGLVAWLASVPRRVGLGRPATRWLLTDAVSYALDDPRHETEIYLDLARALDLRLPDRTPRPRFVPSESDRAVAAAAVAHLGDGPRVAIHPAGGENPGMSMTRKRWPAARFAEIARRSLERGAAVVLLGGPGDGPVARRVVAELESSRHGKDEAVATGSDGTAPALRRVLDLTGRLTLGGTAAVIGACDVYVGNDSGIAHLASAVGTPAVVIFGPTSPVRYGPVPDAGVALAPDPPAAPGMLEPAAGPSVEQVPVEDVWARVERRLGP